MGIATALSATALAAGLAVAGVHAAAASAGPAAATGRAASAAGLTLPSGGVLEQKVEKFCSRVPKLTERADQAQARISGSADTRGSLAWLKAKQAKAQASTHPRLAKRLERVIDRRTERLAKLPAAKQQLSAAKGECTSLNLPTTPSPAPTPSS